MVHTPNFDKKPHKVFVDSMRNYVINKVGKYIARSVVET